MANKTNINAPKESALAVDTTSPFYRVCPYSSCNKPFMYTRSDQKYCSRKCQNDDYNKFRLTRKNTGGPPPESSADNNSSPLIVEDALKEINEPKQTEQLPESVPNEQISIEDPKELIYKMNIKFLNSLVLNKYNEIILHTEVMMDNKFDFTCSSGRSPLHNIESKYNCHFLVFGKYRVYRIDFDKLLIKKITQ
ncbi:MAG: hypothetical protein IPM51_04270 [Sphingobacteriaceae bacterium]|nr:hypothetical protein [Sphingobacteriaceae bacterium]